MRVIIDSGLPECQGHFCWFAWGCSSDWGSGTAAQITAGIADKYGAAGSEMRWRDNESLMSHYITS